jgi:hypothetical protein
LEHGHPSLTNQRNASAKGALRRLRSLWDVLFEVLYLHMTYIHIVSYSIYYMII